MIQFCKDLLIAILVGFLIYIIVLIVTNDQVYSKILWVIFTNCWLLEAKISRLENKLKAMERLFGWDITTKDMK